MFLAIYFDLHECEYYLLQGKHSGWLVYNWSSHASRTDNSMWLPHEWEAGADSLC